MLIKVKYLGRRFPRIVSLQGGAKTSFQPGKLVLELKEYDALALLKLNNRLTPERWEFTVDGVDNQENILPLKVETPKEDKTEQPQEKYVPKEKPKQRGRPKKEK